MGLLRKVLNPELFQGSLHRHGSFEGWYFKLIDLDMATSAAVIPGVALAGGDVAGRSHAFVQVIHGADTRYYEYPLHEFHTDGKEFLVRVGGNTFSREGIRLDLDGPGGTVAGELSFTEALPFPKGPWPGIMGPFGFVPGMECYHGVVTIRHNISGALRVDGQALDFSGGTGYVEKDWGRSFPSCWVWLQAGHFPGSDAAFLFSVADIPFAGSSFTGFFAFLYLDGRLHLLATYTGAKLVSLNDRDGVTHAVIRDRRRTLELAAKPGPGGLLRAPKNGLMDRLIEESIQASVQVRLIEDGQEVFSGSSDCAGMERYEHGRLQTK